LVSVVSAWRVRPTGRNAKSSGAHSTADVTPEPISFTVVAAQCPAGLSVTNAEYVCVCVGEKRNVMSRVMPGLSGTVPACQPGP
jgi:hypothetical protein